MVALIPAVASICPSKASSCFTYDADLSGATATQCGASSDACRLPSDAVFLGAHGGYMLNHRNRQGLSLCSYWYPAVGPAKAVILCIHGNGVCMQFAFCRFQGPRAASTYAGSWIERLNKRGFSVCGIDMQSLGRSEGLYGLRSYFLSWQDLVRDQLQFIDIVRAQDDPQFSEPPLFIVGASMGGCIACHCAHALQAEEWFRGCVLLAGMLTLKKAASPLLVCVVRAIAAVFPSLPLVGGGMEATMRARIPELYEGYKHDPGVWPGNTRVGVAVEFVSAVNALERLMPEMTCPLLVVHAPEDELTDPEGSEQLLKVSASTDKSFFAPREMWHDLVNEAGNEQVLARALAWLEARC